MGFLPVGVGTGWEDVSPGGAASGTRWFACVEPIYKEKHMRSERSGFDA